MLHCIRRSTLLTGRTVVSGGNACLHELSKNILFRKLTVYTNNFDAIVKVIMFLHKGLTHIHWQKKPRLHFGEGFTLSYCFTMFLNSALWMASIEYGWWKMASYFFASAAISIDPYSKLMSELIALMSNADHSFNSSSRKWASKWSQITYE